MSFDITLDFSEIFYTGGAPPSAEVPGRFDVGLGGRGFMIDWTADPGWARSSIPLLRQQADQSSQPTESSINPEDLWRRTISDFSKGAGQRNFDTFDSDPSRFYESKGVDPWTTGQISLLPDTVQKRSSANTNLYMVVAGTYLYLCDGTSIKYTQDLTGTPTWSDITGEPANPASSITSDGFNIWTAHGSDGVYLTTRGGASTASSITGTVNGVRYANGRLFGWATDKLYNFTTTGALPAGVTVLDHPNSDFTWVDVCGGSGFYYAAGYAGDKSLIYKTTVKPDGTALDVASIAGALPDGEIVRSLQEYLGFILIGTDKGLRFAVPNESTGNLTIGGDISIGAPVYAFEPQGGFVWFGWSNHDAASTGLGRFDLSQFNGTRPAYATDLMVTGQGTVQSVITFGDARVLTVSGLGVYTESTDLVAEGTWRTGRMSYGLYDPKVSMFVTVSTSPLDGGIHAAMSVDDGDFDNLSTTGALTGSTSTSFPTNRARGENFDIRLTLSRSDTDSTVGPIVGRLTLRSKPAAARSEQILVPLLLGFEQVDRLGSMYGRDVLDDLDFLTTLEESGESYSYQEAGQSFTVVAEDHVWVPHHMENFGSALNGTYTIRLKRFASE